MIFLFFIKFLTDSWLYMSSSLEGAKYLRSTLVSQFSRSTLVSQYKNGVLLESQCLTLNSSEYKLK